MDKEHTMTDWKSHITVDPDTLVGKPIIKVRASPSS